MDVTVLQMLQFGELEMETNQAKEITRLQIPLYAASDPENRIVLFGLMKLVCPLHVVIILRPDRVSRFCSIDGMDNIDAFTRVVVNNQESTGRHLSFTDGVSAWHPLVGGGWVGGDEVG